MTLVSHTNWFAVLRRSSVTALTPASIGQASGRQEHARCRSTGLDTRAARKILRSRSQREARTFLLDGPSQGQGHLHPTTISGCSKSCPSQTLSTSRFSVSSYPFPRCYWSINSFEHRIDLDRFAFADQLQPFWVTLAKLPFEVCEFIGKLSFGDRDSDRTAAHRNFCDVENVAAFFRFVGNTPKVSCDSPAGMGGLTKPLKLWVMAVARGCSSQDLLGEQCLAPQGNKSYSV
jgi:hypothetical protein